MFTIKLPLFVIILIPILQASTSEAYSCTKPPTLVTSLVSLECSILSDELNLQSLTESFFPANHRQALTVEVHFYVNRSKHPLSPGVTNVTSAEFVFLWFSSSVLAFIEPRVLQGISLNLFIAESHHAHLSIAPFFISDENWIRGLLENVTIWVSTCTSNFQDINHHA